MNVTDSPSLETDTTGQAEHSQFEGRRRLRHWYGLLPLTLVIFFTLFDLPYLIHSIRMPLQQSSDPMMLNSEAELLKTSNMGNSFRQVAFSIAFLLAMLNFYPADSSWLDVLRRQKVMLLLLAYALLSIIWSPAPSLSFKRWLLLAGMVFVFWNAMRSNTAHKQAVRITRYLFALALTISVVVYLWRPDIVITPEGSLSLQAGSWRGIFGHKNSLASAALLAFALWLPCLWSQTSRLDKRLSPWVLLLILFLILKSQGKAASIGIVATMGLCLVLKFPVQGHIKLLLCYIGLATLALWFLHFPQFPFAGYLHDTFGISSNLTGRVPLWQTLLRIFGQHPFLGTGYNAFWTDPNLDQLYLVFVDLTWKPLQGHNAYIDILNELGLIGGFLFLILVIQSVGWAARSSFHEQDTSLSLCLLLFAQLFINIGESYFFNGHSTVWVTFLLTHVALAKQSQLTIS